MIQTRFSNWTQLRVALVTYGLRQHFSKPRQTWVILTPSRDSLCLRLCWASECTAFTNAIRSNNFIFFDRFRLHFEARHSMISRWFPYHRLHIVRLSKSHIHFIPDSTLFTVNCPTAYWSPKQKSQKQVSNSDESSRLPAKPSFSLFDCVVAIFHDHCSFLNLQSFDSESSSSSCDLPIVIFVLDSFFYDHILNFWNWLLIFFGFTEVSIASPSQAHKVGHRDSLNELGPSSNPSMDPSTNFWKVTLHTKPPLVTAGIGRATRRQPSDHHRAFR